MKGTISMLAAVVLAGGFAAAAVSQAAVTRVAVNTGWTAVASAVTLSTVCKDPHCTPGGGQCHDPVCPGCGHCH